jgi:hypothetical protein
MDAGDDGRWMTYDELAEARGIDRQSARRMANRSRWRRQKDNRGVVRVYVPLQQAVRARRHGEPPAGIAADTPADTPADMSADMPADKSRAISVLKAALAAVERRAVAEATALRERAEVAEKRADRAENRAEQAETRANRAEQAVTDERNRADRAESSRDAERTRSDELRDRIEALQVQLVTAEADSSALTIETAELTAQLNQARRQAQEAQDAAEAIRQAEEAERRARGLLARFRAAWRGE